MQIPDEHKKLFETIGRAAESLNQNAYVIGGYVRDFYLNRKSEDEFTDIDFVTIRN